MYTEKKVEKPTEEATVASVKSAAAWQFVSIESYLIRKLVKLCEYFIRISEKKGSNLVVFALSWSQRYTAVSACNEHFVWLGVDLKIANEKRKKNIEGKLVLVSYLL